ncbi:glycosyltransferase family 1 protein [Kocuria palustris]|uniref:glycosyltransferase family 4 protein n=1 Tax=Kocuria palustris TaxID=71999 RepID=UPI0011A0835A|nr:glycosyltransferase family 1 protein [Kocuria palustris]
MRIAVIAEQFLPHMNGVTHSVIRVIEHLRSRGHHAMVICPAADPLQITHTTETLDGPSIGHPELDGVVVHRLPAVPLTGYSDVRLAAGPTATVRRILRRHRPDVVHLASPFVLGWRGVQAAHQLGVPCAAVYQTEIPGYAGRYGAPFLEELLWGHVQTLHNLATVTLAPSSFAIRQLHDHGVQRVHLWRRGVDAVRFDPAKRDEAWRREIGGGRKLIGYVGRLAAEKQVEDLARLDALPDSRLVIVGSGPEEESLRRRLPNAHFAGFQGGEDLARIMAGLDVFVHPGEHETFCQTIQEAMASGVPVVATGRGGPLDLVDQSHNGWLYRPGDLDQMRHHVRDLLGDDAKRQAFARAARATVETRTWAAIGDQLIGHYERARLTSRRHRAARQSLRAG